MCGEYCMRGKNKVPKVRHLHNPARKCGEQRACLTTLMSAKGTTLVIM